MAEGLEEQIREAGIYYPRSYDIAYRAGFAAQAAGATAFSVLYILKSPFFIVPFLLFEAGLALSSLYLLVWKASIKRFILRSLVIGLLLQAVSLLGFPHSDKVFFAGLGFVLVSGAGLTGKEAYCFGWPEGWLLLIAYPVAVLPNFFVVNADRINSVMSVAIAVLWVSFLRKKLSQPLLKSCETGVCGLPPGPRL